MSFNSSHRDTEDTERSSVLHLLGALCVSVAISLSLVGCSTVPQRADLPPMPPGMKYQARAVTVDAEAVVVAPLVVAHPVLAWEINGWANETGLQQSNSPLGPWVVVASYQVTNWPRTYTATTTVTNQGFWRAYAR